MISVIVPVHNSEPYLTRCVESLKCQTYKDIEIILVDDGSTDGSALLCDSISANDHRVRVIHQKNGGASCARNTGLETATGECICFVDSDDYVNDRYLEAMVQAMERNRCDMVLAGRCQIKTDGQKVVSTPPDAVLHANAIRKIFTDASFDYSRGGPYCKLFRADIIEKYKIKFPLNVHYLEDAIFVLEYMLKCENICSVNEANYFYELHNGSLVFSIHDAVSETNGVTKFQELHTIFKRKFNLIGDENYWFDQNLEFLQFRQLRSILKIEDLQEKNKALNMMDWHEYRRLKSKQGIKWRLLNLLTYNKLCRSLLLQYLLS